jgi:ABC-type glycerol-3-phosphate transport system substrate-binding protein
MPNDWVYRHKEKLAPVSKQSINMDLYAQSVAKSVVFNDKIYALSSYIEPLIIYYNPKLFDQTLSDYNRENQGSENAEARKEASRLLKDVPLTWSDFAKTVNLLTKFDDESKIEIAGTAIGTNEISAASDLIYLLMLQNETKIISDDFKQADFNLPSETPKGSSETPGLRAFEFYSSFADPNSENYSWNSDLGSEVDAFANGKVGMIFGYSSLQNYFVQKYPNFKFKRAAVPQLTTDSSKIIDYAKFNAFSVTASTAKYKDKTKACWNLINMISNGSSTDNFNEALKVYTAKKGSAESSFENRNTNSPERVESLTAKSLVKGRYPVEFDKIIKNSIASINQGNQDPQSALDTAARDINEILRKEGW